ncbi:MAG: hypothetical protein IID18_07865 [Nitrospinae bacterium]|nr:hypothetical protein [Nitrospinota bacterium]
MAKAEELKQSPDHITHQELMFHQTDGASSAAITPGTTGWIHCGDFDSSTQFWKKRYIDVPGQSSRSSPAELKGQSGRSPWALDFFDSPPEFSSFELKWEFGNFKGTLRPYDSVKIIDFTELGRGRVWCQVETIA